MRTKLRYPEADQSLNTNTMPNKISIMPKVKLPNKDSGLLPNLANIGKVNKFAINWTEQAVTPEYSERLGKTSLMILLIWVITPQAPVICIIKGISKPKIYAIFVYSILYSYPDDFSSFFLSSASTSIHFCLYALYINPLRVKIAITYLAYSFLFFLMRELGLSGI